MTKLKRFASALATRGLTLDDTRNIHSLTRGQVDDIKWAYAHANEETAKANAFWMTHARYDAWYKSERRKPPHDFRLVSGLESIDDTDLDAVFASALTTRGVTLNDACIDPRTQASSQRELVVWAMSYTIGHARRTVWERELRRDPLTETEFLEILNDPDFNPKSEPLTRPLTPPEITLAKFYAKG